MLKLLLSLPRDVVAFHIVPLIGLVSLARLDSAVISHEYRPSVLNHVFSDVMMSKDDVCTYNHDLICWLMYRQVKLSGLMFPRGTTDQDLVIAAPAIANSKLLDLTRCNNLSMSPTKEC